MKRLLALTLVCVLLFAGCSPRNNSAGGMNLRSSAETVQGNLAIPERTASSIPDAAESEPPVDEASDISEPSDSSAYESSDIPEPQGFPEPEEWEAAQQPAAEHETIRFDVTGDVVEIKEKLFIAQTNDIYLNAEDYLGKTIKYEGIYDEYHDEFSGETYRYVIRYGPGCCGTDGNAGFEVTWEGDPPQKNDWVEVSGVLEEYGENGWRFLRLRLVTLTILNKRGAEYVYQ